MEGHVAHQGNGFSSLCNTLLYRGAARAPVAAATQVLGRQAPERFLQCLPLCPLRLERGAKDEHSSPS